MGTPWFGALGTRSAFALPAVLTTLTILTLIYLTVIVAADDMFKETLQQRRELDFQIDALSVEAELSYWATTQPLNRNAISIGAPPGLEIYNQPVVPGLASKPIKFLRIDGTPYSWGEADAQGPSKLKVQVQDDAGRINFNFASPQTRMRLFELAGLSTSAAQAMAAQTQDYIDNDDLIGLGGAEYQDYQRAGLSPPPNRALNAPAELYGLLGWASNRPPNWAEAAELTTIQYDSSSFNINTASPKTLSVMFGLTEAQANAAVERRRTTPFYAISELGLADNNEQLYTYANGRFHLIISDNVRGFQYRSRLVLTPQNQDRPIWVDLETLQRFTPRDDPEPDGVSAFPKPRGAPDSSR
jgi:hypothetical protein